MQDFTLHRHQGQCSQTGWKRFYPHYHNNTADSDGAANFLEV